MPKPNHKKRAMKFGNKDTEQKYDLSKAFSNTNGIEDKFVVRHFRTVTLADGSQYEDHTTNRFQVYDQKTFNQLSRQGTKDGKQTPSQFSQMGLNVDVIHDPTAESESGVKNAKELIEEIKVAESIEAVDALIEGETRKGVLTAADKRKKELGA